MNMRRHSFYIFLIAAALCTLPTGIASADAIVVTKAMTASTVVEISIEESEIVVEMEIGVPDLLAFHNLLPDEMRAQMGLDAAPLGERLARFFAKDFVIRADGGPPLPGRITAIEPRRRVPRDDLTGEPLPAAPSNHADASPGTTSPASRCPQRRAKANRSFSSFFRTHSEAGPTH